MDKQAINDRLRGIAETVAGEAGVELVHSEIAGTNRNLAVRIFIDKPGGVTIEDCSGFSRKAEAVLDADDFIPSAYVLEVSSPGLERGLYSLQDFEKFTGRQAKVKTAAAIDGQKVFSGKIVEVADGNIVLEDKTSGVVRFPFSSVAKANLKIDLGEEFRTR